LDLVGFSSRLGKGLDGSISTEGFSARAEAGVGLGPSWAARENDSNVGGGGGGTNEGGGGGRDLGGAIEIIGGGGGGNVDDEGIDGYVDDMDTPPSGLTVVGVEGGLARVELVAAGVNLIFNPDFGAGGIDELFSGRISDVVLPADIEVLGLSLTLSLPGLEASGLIRDGAGGGGGGNPGDIGDDDTGGIIEPPAAKAANDGGGASGTTLFGVTINFASVGCRRPGFTPPRPLA
jgi:hypothetical protein